MTIELTPETVPLRDGLPTREELLVHYPAKFTWQQLKIFVNSGDLGLLKRDKKLQKRYDKWAVGITERYGSLVNYLLNYRLQWGKPDTLSLLQSSLDRDDISTAPTIKVPEAQASPTTNGKPIEHKALPPLPENAPKYFTVETPPEYISIIQNDWPYSVPADVEHTLIWTRVPIYHPSIIHPSIQVRINQDGLCGFTGLNPNSPPPSPSLLPQCLPALAEWGITKEKMIVSEKGTEEEERLVKEAGKEVDKFVKMRWDEGCWETAWFVNPPRLQSVPGLAHIHVFAKRKD